ncbi:MAG: flagellar motor switch protein FliM [Phycisphaeraceae bacterium]|nr:flagellar motor switch protein FliM [Phycisphaeraceae bacterium]
MAEILDQSEVDALLAAVEGGQVSKDDGDAPVIVYTSPERGGILTDVEVRPYDFKRPERVSKDQMRALENLHEGFARNFGAALSGFLRTIVEVKVANIEQMTFSEFTHSLPNPTCFNLLAAEPLDGSMCMEISPLIIYPIIDRLLGGSNADLFIPQRPLTAIEQRLVQKILDRAMSSLREAWASITPLKFSLEETESNPQLVQIVPPNEVVVVVGFEIKMGGRAGTMSLCIPYNVIEPVMDKLSNQTWAAYKRNRRDAKLRQRVSRRLETAKLTISTVLAETKITMRDLISLQVGDLIVTEKPAKLPMTLLIEGRRKFVGHIGQHRGNRAFKVARPIHPKDRV